MQNKQVKSPPHQSSGGAVAQQQRNSITNGNSGSSVAYGLTSNSGQVQTSSRQIAGSATTTVAGGTTRSHERISAGGSDHKTSSAPQVASFLIQPGGGGQQVIGFTQGNAAAVNYYYSQGTTTGGGNIEFQGTSNMGVGGGSINSGANFQYNQLIGTPNSTGAQSKIKKISQQQLSSQQQLNAAAAIQAYATIQQTAHTHHTIGGGKQPHTQIRKQTLSNDSQPNTMSPQQHYAYQSAAQSSQGSAGLVAQLYQQQASSGSKKNQIPNSTQQNYGTNNSMNRYESLQNKLKNKRRVQPANNLLASNSQLIGGGSGSSSVTQSQGKSNQTSEPLKFNQTQKIVATAFGIGGGVPQNVNPPAGTLTTNRKQLKLSLDQHSDSSFNNMSIKSADKHNSVVRAAAGLLSAKNQGTLGLNVKDLSSQISPSSYNGGGSIIQNLTSSQNSVYSSHFSNNSRFTSTRPKNPTDSSSLSSKNSDTLSANGGVLPKANILLDIKKTAAQKLTNKVTNIQTLKDQQQQKIIQQQFQQSDSMSDTGEGSFSSNHENNVQQKPLSTKLCTNINTKNDNIPGSDTQIQKEQISSTQYQVQSNIVIPQSNIQSLAKIGSQAKIPVSQQSATQNTYKSKFTLVSRSNEHIPISKESKKVSQPSSHAGGADSYRRNSDVHQQQKTTQQTTGSKPVNCGAPFSPKANQQTGPITINAKIIPSTKSIQSQILQGIIAQHSNQRNAGANLHLKSAGSTDSKGGSLNQGKKSNREAQQQKAPAQSIKEQQAQQLQQQSYASNYESNMNYVKPGVQKTSTQSNELTVASTKLNLDQLQNIIKQQQSQHRAMASETIHEERFEDSEQNTKRESTAQNQTLNQQSTNQLHQQSAATLKKQGSNMLSTKEEIANMILQQPYQPVTVQSMSQKSKSLLTINLDSTDNLKRVVANQADGNSVKAQGAKTSQRDLQQPMIIQDSSEAAPPSNGVPTSSQSQSMVEEIKSNPTLQALKEQLKSQIAKQHHAFSNPNQPSSQIEAEEIQYPITPQKALKLFNSNLTEFERTEILEYSEIYFLGLNAPKIKGSPQVQHNMGYDDDRGDYQVVLKDHLCYRYEVHEFLGKGSFGQALKCYDYKTNQFLAVKIIRNKKRFHHQAGVELNILSYLKEHDPDDVNNIIRIKDYSIFRKHLIISFELLSINLYEFIKNNNFQGVSLGLIRRFAIQILQALKYQRDHGIIHCDLKPENILLKQPNKSGIKIIDYGSSCFQNQRIYTYIQSRFYRAPEIILGIPYTTSIDMWSFGCILAELYTGFPLFPGENEMEQLAYIMEIKGVPEDYLLELSSRKKLFFDTENQPIIVANSRGKKRRPLSKTLKGVLKCSDQNFLNFIDACLDWDPVNRMTPLEALQHDWILEGLPPKVLIHHQRMFGVRDDKTNIKEATLTQIQGFPPDAEANSIFNLLKSKRLVAHSQEESKNSQVDIGPLSPTSNLQQDQLQKYEKGQTPQIVYTLNSQSQNSINGGQPKKNKTIQNLVQELFEEKVQQNERTQSKNGKDSQNGAPKAPSNIESSTFYQQKPFQGQQSFKNQTMTLQKMKELDSQIAPSTQQEVPDEDMEEGIHFNKTQKIPISLIKQQEKIPVHQVPFYNPKVSGPKLNNYVSQAAAFSKKTHSSTSNLVNRGFQTQNYSATLGQQTINSSFNHQANVCSVSNFNIIPPGPYVEGGHIPVSSRSNKNNISIQQQNMQPSSNLIPSSIASIQLQQLQYKQMQQHQLQSGHSTIKIDLTNSMSDPHIETVKSNRRLPQ